MLFPAGAQIAQQLCDVFIGHCFACLEFDNENILDKAGRLCTRPRPSHPQRVLLHHLDPRLPKSVGKAVLINLFKVAMTQIAVQSKACLPNLIAQFKNFLLFHSKSLPFCVSCASLRQISLPFSGTEYRRFLIPQRRNRRVPLPRSFSRQACEAPHLRSGAEPPPRPVRAVTATLARNDPPG